MDLTHVRDSETTDYLSMNEAGRIAAETHEQLASILEVGTSSLELDRVAETFIRDHGAKPAFRAFGDYSRTITVSINDQLIHAPPHASKVLEAGDVVSIDLGACYKGHYSDTAVTYIVGEAPTAKHEELVNKTRTALYAGIQQAVAGNSLSDVGRAIADHSGPFGNVVEWTGHFIGRQLHLGPKLYNRAHQKNSLILQPGMCVAIEPILTLSSNANTSELSEGGVVSTVSGAPGAHFEHTVRVHEDRAEILTSRTDEPDFL
ncbi:MAG: type I methionyl aminopeptidase [bacterium]